MKNIEIIKKSKIWYLISGILCSISLLSIIFFGLKVSIDFTGGSLMEIRFSDISDEINIISASSMKKYFDENIADEITGEFTVQKVEDDYYMFKFQEVDEEKHQEILSKIREKLDPNANEEAYQFIGSIIGNELKEKTYITIFLVISLIILYIAWAFRKVSYPVSSWKYGIGAIIALIHDVLIMMGVFSILGLLFNIQIDILFITAILTTLGYSVNDTIVIYDRIRENLKRTNDKFDVLVNKSINENIKRSIYTSSTTLIVLLSIYFFGGTSVKNFVLALIIGVVVGTYSSIFIASPLLVSWNSNRK
ncbi:protein translocase subunit SecF [Patescibacteria group bacterium]|nr:protein translocase subunit SecF [Patescibacteria group bacterium]